MFRCPPQVVIVGERGAEDMEAMLRCVHAHFLPTKSLILHDPSDDSATAAASEGGRGSFLTNHLAVLANMKKIDGKATAYLCENYTCSAPINDVDKLKRQLAPRRN